MCLRYQVHNFKFVYLSRYMWNGKRYLPAQNIYRQTNKLKMHDESFRRHIVSEAAAQLVAIAQLFEWTFDLIILMRRVASSTQMRTTPNSVREL